MDRKSKIIESASRNNGIWYKRIGWNEEWIWTSEPIWDFEMFEYKTSEEFQEET